MDNGRSYYALLNVVFQGLFGESEVTFDQLCAEAFPGIDEEQVKEMMGYVEAIFERAARNNADVAQMEGLVGGLVGKQLSEKQAQLIVKFWKDFRGKAHAAMQRRCTWNPQLKKLAWRVDVVSKSREHDQLNEPVTIMEIRLDHSGVPGFKPSRLTPVEEVVQFEMNTATLRQLVANVEDAQKVISQISGTI